MLAKLEILKFRRLAWILLHKANAKRESLLLTSPSSPIENYNGQRQKEKTRKLGLLQSSLKQETCINSILTATTQNISQGACEEGP